MPWMESHPFGVRGPLQVKCTCHCPLFDGQEENNGWQQESWRTCWGGFDKKIKIQVSPWAFINVAGEEAIFSFKVLMCTLVRLRLQWAGKRRERMYVCMYTLNSVISTPCNITHSLVSRNPWERMFVFQIALLIVTFLSLISRILSLIQATKEVNPHPRIAPCVNMWSVTFFFLCHLLNVGECVCHIAREGEVKWTTPTEVRGEWIQVP